MEKKFKFQIGDGIYINCYTPEDAFQVYNGLGHMNNIIMNGEPLKSKGADTENPNAYYAGYTRSFFKRKYEEMENPKKVSLDELLEEAKRLSEQDKKNQNPDGGGGGDGDGWPDPPEAELLPPEEKTLDELKEELNDFLIAKGLLSKENIDYDEFEL